MNVTRATPILFLGLCLASPAAALTRPGPVTLPDLARQSAQVVTARITTERVVWNEDHSMLLTEYTAAATRRWKGADEPLVFILAGGETEKFGLQVPGMPRARVGGEYLLALRAADGGRLELAAPGVGLWPIREGRVEGLGLRVEEIADALAGKRAAPQADCPISCVPPLATNAGLPLKWPGDTPMGEPFMVNPSPPAGCATSNDWVSLVNASAEVWNDVRMGWCFTSGGTTSLTSKGRQPDGFNVVHAGSAHGALAFTTIWYDPPTGNVVENDMVVDGGKGFISWGCATTGAIGADQYDLFATVLHEFGHFLVLADVYDTGCEALTMFGVGFRGDIEPRTLESADVCGAQSLYGTRDQRCVALSAAATGAQGGGATPEAITELMTAGPGGIRFTLNRPGPVSVGVYDLAGRLVYKFPTLFLEAGPHALNWGGRGTDGGEVSYGIYFARVTTRGGASAASKVLWLK